MFPSCDRCSWWSCALHMFLLEFWCSAAGPHSGRSTHAADAPDIPFVKRAEAEIERCQPGAAAAAQPAALGPEKQFVSFCSIVLVAFFHSHATRCACSRASNTATGHTTANAVSVSVLPQAWMFRLLEVLWQQRLGFSGLHKVAGTAVVCRTEWCTA